MRRRGLAAALGALALGVSLAVATGKPVALTATGDRVVIAYRALGRTWLLPRSPRTAWAVPLPGGPDGVALAGFSRGDGLFAIAGGEARAFRWPSADPGARPERTAVAAIGPDSVRRALAADVDADGVDELLLLRGEPAPLPESRPGLAGRLEVWQVRDRSLRLIWQGLEKYSPWRLATGDVDGDGAAEWAVGVWTRAVYDPRWAERPWLYRWKAGQPFALWLGSRLAHPFSDFAIVPQASGRPALLAAVEAARDGGQTLSLYRWNGFGFTLDFPGPAWQAITAFAPLPPEPGCAALAAVVAPEQTLVLLDLPAAGEEPLREVARHPLAGGAGPIAIAAAPGQVWLLQDGRLAHFSTCPRPAPEALSMRPRR